MASRREIIRIEAAEAIAGFREEIEKKNSTRVITRIIKAIPSAIRDLPSAIRQIIKNIPWE